MRDMIQSLDHVITEMLLGPLDCREPQLDGRHVRRMQSLRVMNDLERLGIDSEQVLLPTGFLGVSKIGY